MKIDVFQHASIKLSGSDIIYFDPYKIDYQYNDADYIFITHDHYDHFDLESIKKVIKATTTLIVPESLKMAVSTLTDKVLLVKPDNDYTVGNITFKTISAYNIGKPFHPKDKGYVGYLVTIQNKTYYIMGDTDLTPDVRKVSSDVTFIPIDGIYTMSTNDAATYIDEQNLSKVIPIHYGSEAGSIDLGRKLQELVTNPTNIELKIEER